MVAGMRAPPGRIWWLALLSQEWPPAAMVLFTKDTISSNITEYKRIRKIFFNKKNPPQF
jgi:hypothetical protein